MLARFYLESKILYYKYNFDILVFSVKLIASILFLIIYLFSMPKAYAGEDYSCTISQIHSADNESNTVNNAYKKQYLGKNFTVERTSGLMIGALKNSYITKPQVIDYGSSENSYKVVTTLRKEQGAGVGSSINALTILEYVVKPKKPFIFMDGEHVFIGKCVHF